MGSNRGDQAIRESIKVCLKEKVDAPIAYFNCKTDLLDRKRINQLNKEASMLLIAGSGLYTNYDLESGFYFRCNSYNFERIKVPIVLFSLGMNNHLKMDRFGPLKESTLQSIKRLNTLSSHSSVRDFRTLEMLHDLGIRKAKFVPDPAVFCPQAILPKKYKVKNLVGLSIAQHAEILKYYRPKIIGIFSNLCKYLSSKGFNPIFIAHDALEHNIYEDLVSNCPNLLYYNNDSPREMKRIYKECKFTIGVRCHSNIMSFGALTPFICLAYDQKQVEFCKITDMSPYMVRINEDLSFELVMAKVNQLLGNAQDVTAQIKVKREGLNQIFNDAVDEIVGYVKC